MGKTTRVVFLDQNKADIYFFDKIPFGSGSENDARDAALLAMTYATGIAAGDGNDPNFVNHMKSTAKAAFLRVNERDFSMEELLQHAKSEITEFHTRLTPHKQLAITALGRLYPAFRREAS